MTNDKFGKISKVFLAVMMYVIAIVSACYVGAVLDVKGGAFNWIVAKLAIVLSVCTIVDGLERFHVAKTTYFEGKARLVLLIANAWAVLHAFSLLIGWSWFGAILFLAVAGLCFWQFCKYAKDEADNDYTSTKLTEELNDKQKELEGAKHAAESYKTQIEQLNGRLETAMKDASECHTEIDRLNDELKQASKNYDDAKAKVEELQKKIEQLEQTRFDMEKELNAVKQERSILKSQYDKQSNDIKAKTAEIDKLSTELIDKNNKLGEANKQIKLLQDANNTMIDDKAKLQDKIDDYVKDLQSVNDELATQKARNNDLQKALDEKSKAFDDVKLQLDNTLNDMEKVQKSYNDLKELYDNLLDKQAEEHIDIEEYKALKEFKAKYEASQAKKAASKKTSVKKSAKK